MNLNNETDLTSPTVNFTREGFKIGVINGLFAVLIMYCSYYIGLDAFVNVQVAAKFIPYMSIILVVYGLQLRRRNGGYLLFKEGIKYSYLSYFVSAIILAIGTYILYNLIDPTLTQKSFELVLQKTRTSMAQSGVSKEEMERLLGDAAKGKQETTLRSIIGGMGFGLILDFILSIIVTLIIRKEKPVLGEA